MSTALSFVLLFVLIALLAVFVFLVWRYGFGQDELTPGALPGTPAAKDELTLIKGIGPVLEKRLNELGITTFRQIAGLTGEDIQRVNSVLEFKGRIEREGWVRQARELMATGSRPQAAETGRRTGAKSRRKKSRKIKAERVAAKNRKSSKNKL